MRGRWASRKQVRIVLALLLVAVGLQVAAQPAMAGGVDTDDGRFAAGVYNLTPYTWTLVKSEAPQSCDAYVIVGGCWQQLPAATLAPGASTNYILAQNYQQVYSSLYSYVYGYNGWFTYRVDVAGAPAEYITIAVSQAYRSGVYGNDVPALRQFITTTAPPDDYNPGSNPDPYPAPATPDPQLTYQVGVPQEFDLTYTLIGNHTVDAKTSAGAALAKLLDGLCSASTGTGCSFAQEGQIAWSSGDPGSPYLATNCAPPNGLPSSYTVSYEVAQSQAFTVGGGISATAQFQLGEVFANSVTVSVEAEHEWRQTSTFTRTSTITIPAGDIGLLFVAPTVAVATGTLTLTSPNSTFTVTNFSETRSGVTRDALTPAYNVLTYARPMTPTELSVHCPAPPTAQPGRAADRSALPGNQATRGI